MGTQKNRLNETVLLSTQNICYIVKIGGLKNINNFPLKIFVYLNQCKKTTIDNVVTILSRHVSRAFRAYRFWLVSLL